MAGREESFSSAARRRPAGRTGRCVTEAETELDIRTMKQNNINAIRTRALAGGLQRYPDFAGGEAIGEGSGDLHVPHVDRPPAH